MNYFLTLLAIGLVLEIPIVLSMQSIFRKRGYIISPKAFKGNPLFRTSTTRSKCTLYCLSNAMCKSFLHNSLKDECLLVMFGQQAAPDSSYPNIPSNNFVWFVRTDLPQSCSDVQTIDKSESDGEYLLYPDVLHGQRVSIFCYEMDTGNPKEYVTLHATNYGYYPPIKNFRCTGETMWEATKNGYLNSGRIDYEKIRVDIDTMIVDRTDKTFATLTGGFKYKEYGTAADCYNEFWSTPTDPALPCGPKGMFIINTKGTGLVFNNQTIWSDYGYGSTALYSWYDKNRVVNITCGGWAGRCEPDVLKLEIDPNGLT